MARSGEKGAEPMMERRQAAAGAARAAVSAIFPEQHQQAARALGRAFIKDPAMLAVLPEPTEPVERARRLAQLFEAVIRINQRQGQPVLGVVKDSKVAAVAVIEGAHTPSLGQTMVSGVRELPQLISAIGWGGTIRALRLGDTLYRNRPEKPHLYLNLLGVDPDYQRQHLGIALLDHLRDLAAARHELAGVYLETATEANVAYYTRAGYQILGEMYPLGVRMWRMMQPRPGGQP
jgi:ribosomal protein S18 acetylase RimI-like enzyme